MDIIYCSRRRGSKEAKLYKNSAKEIAANAHEEDIAIRKDTKHKDSELTCALLAEVGGTSSGGTTANTKVLRQLNRSLSDSDMFSSSRFMNQMMLQEEEEAEANHDQGTATPSKRLQHAALHRGRSSSEDYSYQSNHTPTHNNRHQNVHSLDDDLKEDPGADMFQSIMLEKKKEKKGVVDYTYGIAKGTLKVGYKGTRGTLRVGFKGTKSVGKALKRTVLPPSSNIGGSGSGKHISFNVGSEGNTQEAIGLAADSTSKQQRQQPRRNSTMSLSPIRSQPITPIRSDMTDIRAVSVGGPDVEYTTHFDSEPGVDVIRISSPSAPKIIFADTNKGKGAGGQKQRLHTSATSPSPTARRVCAATLSLPDKSRQMVSSTLTKLSRTATATRADSGLSNTSTATVTSSSTSIASNKIHKSLQDVFGQPNELDLSFLKGDAASIGVTPATRTTKKTKHSTSTRGEECAAAEHSNSNIYHQGGEGVMMMDDRRSDTSKEDKMSDMGRIDNLQYESLVARALWESHWREEWCGIYSYPAPRMDVYAPFTSQPAFSIGK
jgi:hypothetical protein